MAAKSGTKKRGAKTKYKPSLCDDLYDHLVAGKSFDSFCGVAGIVSDTAYRWVSKYPEFKEAKELGEKKALELYEDIGYQFATGKNPQGNVTAWIFIMKNRFGWRDKIEQTTNLHIDGIAFVDEDDE